MSLKLRLTIRFIKIFTYMLIVPILFATSWTVCGYRAETIPPIPEVKIPQGIIRGSNMVTHGGRNIFGFRGIPYARPPIGDLRFKGPVPPDPWDGIFNASEESSPCPQLDGTAIIGDEDCLYLNVYTPRLPANGSSLLPVILYVVGGSFKSGHNHHTRWGPYFLLNKDVLLVVPSYRMGALGYLSTGDEVAPGNYALKDLVRALQWNRENIEYFGGDPNQVTLMGGSSGAITVHLLALSDSTNGLFHRYITQSGSAFVLPTYRPRKELAERAVQIGEHLGCPTNTSIELVDCLKKVNASQLVEAGSLLTDWKYFPIVVLGPTIEPKIEGAFLTETPMDLFERGKIRDLPWLSSVTRDEGILYTAMFFERLDQFQEILDRIDSALPEILQYDNLVDDVKAFTDTVKSYYFNDLTADRTLLLNNFTQLCGDFLFVHPAYRGAQRQLQIHRKNTTYFASFEYRGTMSYSYWFSNGSTKNYGVSHGDEILYLFKNLNTLFGTSNQKMNEADLKMVDTMVQMWTSFAITGTPTAYPTSSVIWEPYSWRKNYLRIGSNSDTSIEMEDNFLHDRMQFWENLMTATTWKRPF